MSDGSKIEWTDATWNPITGCSVVSPGCTNCYAMRLAGTRLQHHPSRAGLTRPSAGGPVWTGEVRLNEQWLDQPLRWRRSRMIFVCAHGDLFHPAVPDEWIDRVVEVMKCAPQHIFQVLTKRPERMQDYFAGLVRRKGSVIGKPQPPTHQWPLPNVWLGVSAEDQRRADERIPILLETLAAVRWVSAEPLLGPVRMGEHGLHGGPGQLDWVVVGGESGAGARACDIGWIERIVGECAAAGVPVHVKQLGARVTSGDGVTLRTRHSKGGDPAEWPERLRVREWPRAMGERR